MKTEHRYNIKELCDQVIAEIKKNLILNMQISNIDKKQKNIIICDWINKHYQKIFKNYLKTHPF